MALTDLINIDKGTRKIYTVSSKDGFIPGRFWNGLCAKHGKCMFIDAPSLLRLEIVRGSKLGEEVIKHITMGRNVPSTILSDIVTNALNENKHISHGAAVVYGYPNTIQQQMAFSRNLEDNMFGSALFIDQLVVGGANNKQLMSQNVDKNGIGMLNSLREQHEQDGQLNVFELDPSNNNSNNNEHGLKQLKSFFFKCLNGNNMVTTPTPSTPNSIGLNTPNELTTKLSSDSNTSTSGNNYTFQFDGLNKTTPISTPETNLSYNYNNNNNSGMPMTGGSINATPGSSTYSNSTLKQNHQYPSPPIHQQYQPQQQQQQQQQQPQYGGQSYQYNNNSSSNPYRQQQQQQQQQQRKPVSNNRNGPRTFKQRGGIHKSAKNMGFPKLKQSKNSHNDQNQNRNTPPINNNSPIKNAISNNNNNSNNNTPTPPANLRSTAEERALELIKWLKRETKLPRKKHLERKPLLVQWKRYFTNGFVIGKLIEIHHIEAGYKFVKALKILDDGSSTDIKLDNWDLLKKYCNRRQVKFPMKDKEIKDIQEMKSIDAIIILMTRLYYYLHTLRAIVIPKLDVNVIGPNPLPALIAEYDAKNNTTRKLPQWKIDQQQREQQMHLTGGIGGGGGAYSQQQQQQHQGGGYGGYQQQQHQQQQQQQQSFGQPQYGQPYGQQQQQQQYGSGRQY